MSDQTLLEVLWFSMNPQLHLVFHWSATVAHHSHIVRKLIHLSHLHNENGGSFLGEYLESNMPELSTDSTDSPVHVVTITRNDLLVAAVLGSPWKTNQSTSSHSETNDLYRKEQTPLNEISSLDRMYYKELLSSLFASSETPFGKSLHSQTASSCAPLRSAERVSVATRTGPLSPVARPSQNTALHSLQSGYNRNVPLFTLPSQLLQPLQCHLNQC